MLDALDRQILAVLMHHGRATLSEIGRLVNLSPPAVGTRLKRLEQSGVIDGYCVRVNRRSVGLRLLAWVTVTLEATRYIDSFRAAVTTCVNVLECHHIAGQGDYLLKVLVKDTEALELFLSRTLKGMNGVVATNTTICLSTLKEEINVTQEIL